MFRVRPVNSKINQTLSLARMMIEEPDTYGSIERALKQSVRILNEDEMIEVVETIAQWN